MDRIVKLITASSVALAVPTGASAGCWNARSTVAAEIRALDVMLMVSALRCRLEGADFVGDYNHFVRTNRAALTGAVDDLRTHFDEGDGWRPSLERFDSYVTAIANEHGERGQYSCQDLRLITEDAIDADGDQQQLLGLARAVGITPRFVGGICRAEENGWSRDRWTAAAARPTGAGTLPPVVTSVGTAEPAAIPAEPVVVAAAPIAARDLPVTQVAEAPVAEPLPPEASGPAPAVAQASTAAQPALQSAVATVVEAPATASRGATFDLASGSVTVPEGGEIEVVVSEGPEQNGVRSRTYRIRRPSN